MSRRRKLTDTTPFDTLRLEGTLFVPELLERAARGEAAAQKEADYGVPKGLKLHDEYGRAYRIAAALWQDFAPQLPRTDLDPARLTRAFVLDLLRQCLGYTDIALLQEALLIGDRGFPITAQALGGRFPVIIAPHSLGLDDPDPGFAIHGSGSKKKSAHQLAQEFLNADRNSLWAIVTNGRTLRLLRDADTLTRPNFLEFDLETILREGEDRYADFSALWRILHASRSGTGQAQSSSPTDCIWEKWKSEGHAQGLRVREGLRAGVTQALLILGTGFLTHRDNDALRQRLHEGTLTKEDYFLQLLRLIYRYLFLFCAEERDLIHTPPPADTSDPRHSEFLIRHSAARKAYAEGYSLRRLRNRSLRQTAHDSHADLWLSLRIVFRALSSGQSRLALPALGGLFAETQCPDLDSAALANRDLLAAMRQLRWSSASGSLTAIDYRNMGPEELGSVYESLLELVPQLDLPARTFDFIGEASGKSTSGNDRKKSGSYYTPDSLVQELIKSALDPVIADRLAAQPHRPIEALLSITVCDPSCGSGHFLLAAARRLAEKLAELRAPDGAVRPDDYRHALREVIARCIHGVDRNPLALELARTVLWLEGVDPGLPLSFLEHHLVCGDALLGLTDLRQLENGIPDAAFTALSGDDKKLCTDLKKQNKAARKQLDDLRSGQDLLAPPGQPDALSEFSALESLPEATPEEIAAKEAAWLTFLTHTRESPLARAADVFVGAFLAPKPTGTTPPDTRALAAALFPAKATPELTTQIDHARQLCDRDHANVLHWPLAFPKIFARGGFDCILGNPPWEVSQLGEEEYFASRSPTIAALAGAKRKKAITELENDDPALWNEFQQDKRFTEASNTFIRESGRFALTAVGKLNTYPLFADTISQLTAPIGRAGFIVPTGIATDDSTKDFFASIATGGRIVSLFDFENRAGLFPAIDSRMKFCTLTLGKASESTFAFYLTQTDQLDDKCRRFTLAAEDFRLINPNTRTCPVFRSRADAELTRSVYRRVPVLIRERRDNEPEVNPWGLRFMQGLFNMTSASHMFHSQPGDDRLPLYEAKMIHQFDHRWAGYGSYTGNGEDESSGTLTLEQKQDSHYTATPRYWVERSAVDWRLLDDTHPLYPLFHARLETRSDSLAWWFRCWLWGQELLAQHTAEAAFLRKEMDDARMVSHDVMELAMKFDIEKAHAEKMARQFPLSPAEQSSLWNQIRADNGLHVTGPREFGAKSSNDLSPRWLDLAEEVLPIRDRRWLMGWRDICRATDERTVITSVMPRSGVGHTLPLFVIPKPAYLAAAFLGSLNSLVLDFVARQKVGGTHLTYGYIKQLPILPPEAYSEDDLAYIVPRVLELTYTAHDMRPWAEDVISSYQRQFPQHPPLVPDPANSQPFPFDPDRRAQLRADLDARYTRLYGLNRDELRYILDPADTHGPDYPTETFRVLKTNELKQQGEYRTRRLVLEAWDRLASEDGSLSCGPYFQKRGIKPNHPETMNPIFQVSPASSTSLLALGPGDTYYARVDQSEFQVPSDEGTDRTFVRLDAFSQPWFDDYRESGFVDPGKDKESFVRFYAEAHLAVLELEIIRDHTGSFPLLEDLLDSASKDLEPDDWFQIRVGGPRRGAPLSEAVPLTVYPRIYGEGISLTLDSIKQVDPDTRTALEAAVDPVHIQPSDDKGISPILEPLKGSIDWAVVYDVGQGNAIGLCNATGGVLAYFDFGRGTGAHSQTFPASLQRFCFTQNPPIILSHWDSDHWHSANHHPDALLQDWIAPQQKLGPTHAAMIANIQAAGGRVWLLPSHFPRSAYGQVQIEMANGSGRNNSGIVLTLSESLNVVGRQILMPGDADYQHITSFYPDTNLSPYLSVVAAHHGGKLKARTVVPGNPADKESRLVYSAGQNNHYGHPLQPTRERHHQAGWLDPAVDPAAPRNDGRETFNRNHPPGYGHVYLGWHLPPPPWVLLSPCGGRCNLEPHQS